ncbi:MAG: patatin-like phospholipase family protein [Bacteroidota bacterium]|nr:patatin-like phospholipase family protein [Bacteroidota bacterium]
MANGTAKLTIDDFIKNNEVVKCIDSLKSAFPAGAKPLVVSDVVDGDNHQYVNLVQKGGGVLGIALVGYTYILEEMGIRFIRLAGTSAGAINTALMTVIGKKEDAKSTRVLDAICKLNFFDLVDGHPAARWIIRNFITHGDFSAKIKKWMTGIIATLIILLAGDFIFLGWQHSVHWLSTVTMVLFIITGIFLLMAGVLIFYILSLMKRLKNAGFGINPGDYFYDWIKKQLIDNGVKTVTDLQNKAAEDIPGLRLRVDHEDGLQGLKGDVTFITSELVTQNKIQFPAMWNLFRNDIDSLQPAGFIRASMSIPVFFESYFINDIPQGEEMKRKWLDAFGIDTPPANARFVDGGILSNFPINLFYNPKIITPRLPSFGIDLDDSRPGDSDPEPENWSLLGYFGRMFNTIRFYYDKDFLLKNKVFQKGIGTIPLAGYNWLNFFLSDQDKIDMFVRGAKAATEFLMKFDWEGYKDERKDMRKKLLREHALDPSAAENNLHNK